MYLGDYLRLAEDDWCSIPENNPLPRYFTTQEKELFEIGVVNFECLASLLHQSVESELEDAVLVEVRSIGARVSTLHA
jgi:hypothetical protein